MASVLMGIGVFACWVMIGLAGTWLMQKYAYGDGMKTDSFKLAFLGPIFLILSLLFALFTWDEPMYLRLADRKNPFRNEIRDALQLWRGLQWMAGDSAEYQREKLVETIRELRQWPAKLREQDADRFIAGMRSEYDAVHARSDARQAAYEMVKQEIRDEQDLRS